MYYKLQTGVVAKPILKPMDHLIGKVVLIVMGGVIGLSMGLYVAARVLPLPNETVIYVPRN